MDDQDLADEIEAELYDVDELEAELHDSDDD